MYPYIILSHTADSASATLPTTTVESDAGASMPDILGLCTHTYPDMVAICIYPD